MPFFDITPDVAPSGNSIDFLCNVSMDTCPANEALVFLSPPAGFVEARAFDINERGSVAGAALRKGGSTGVVWRAPPCRG